jgi:hypothetical protein
VQTAPGQSLQGSNTLAQLSFQTLPNQSSAFVWVPVTTKTALRADGTTYPVLIGNQGCVAVVSDKPLLQALASSTNRVLSLFGKAGASYQLQYCTNFSAPQKWYPLLTYSQTNVSQSFNLPATNSLIGYRLLQQ